MVLAYVAALAAAAATIAALDWGPLAAAAAADVVATLVVFAFSAAFRNSSFYDPYWSVAPPLLAGYWWWQVGAVTDPRAWLMLVLVTLWAVRLTGNWAYGWRGLGHEDWRYVDLNRRLGAWYWPVSLLGVHLLPTVVVFLGCLPLYYALAAGAGLGAIDALALVVGAAALWLESRADLELHRFRARRQSRAELLDTGVWSWCRHPNYLGELGFWVALALFGLAAGMPLGGYTGVLAMLLLFTAISIPMIERALADAKPGYASYRNRTFGLVPLSRLRGRG